MLPAELLGEGISLASQNVAETVFKPPEALRVIDALNAIDGRAIILGGDFWRKAESGEFSPAYENWYMTEPAGEENKSHSQRSMAMARSEIVRRLNTDYWVALVVDVLSGLRVL